MSDLIKILIILELCLHVKLTHTHTQFIMIPETGSSAGSTHVHSCLAWSGKPVTLQVPNNTDVYLSKQTESSHKRYFSVWNNWWRSWNTPRTERRGLNEDRRSTSVASLTRAYMQNVCMALHFHSVLLSRLSASCCFVTGLLGEDCSLCCSLYCKLKVLMTYSCRTVSASSVLLLLHLHHSAFSYFSPSLPDSSSLILPFLFSLSAEQQSHWSVGYSLTAGPTRGI